ncbi:structure-specific endonuclease subunit SLX1 homolog [Anopheles aquasalis]|uniref:structure-specific endonuclease subunit SLX1 homolog n=1 Tax=Anopheles aquasalis TaxID=42839 RepID=UPI00215AB53D|nr:structure-specific endonuclease subunit SLX1 homolog [Anopheles aquasalis]
MAAEEEIADFYGVYLLVSKSTNPKFAGRTYIGYTVDPNRRIKQHNRGKDAGGAFRTSNRGPWTMVMIVHGFPNNISALRFEWAWQQPRVSRRLKQIPEIQKKQRKETNFEYNFRILSEMLRIGPWNRLPLTIRWLAEDFHREFAVGKTPPLHMPICFGRVKMVKKGKPEKKGEKKKKKIGKKLDNKIPIQYDLDEFDRLVMGGEKVLQGDDDVNHAESITISSGSENESEEDLPTDDATRLDCVLCSQSMSDGGEGNNGEEAVVRCIQPRCALVCHIECLAKQVLEPGQYVPIEGDCPICETHFLWGDLIRKSNGCCDLIADAENVDPLEINDVSDDGD